MKRGLSFAVRPESFSIHRLPVDRHVDLGRLGAATWYSITRTSDEVSIVAPEGIDFGSHDSQVGWRCLQIAQLLDFSLVGVLAGICAVLARANISVFAISTYNTDYILVRAGDLDPAVAALRAAGHVVAGAA